MIKTTPEQRVKLARSVATKAINEAANILCDPAIKSRSTASRAAYKTKADALERVARILNGKE